jgi:hypothetical protein
VPRRAAALLLLIAGLGTAAPCRAEGKDVLVRDDAGLRRALEGAGPGSTIRLAPGAYAGGVHAVGLVGTRAAPISVRGADPAQPPVFRGGGSGLQLSDPVFVVVADLVIEGASGNGLNVDDGGTPDTPARDLTIERVVVRDIGPDGNCDGIKLSGVDGLRVADCRVERWGRGGSAIDLVGCRDGTIEGCVFRHEPGLPSASGVQLKGGTRDVAVRRCRFLHAGSRAVNAGGSTGLEWFRPALSTWKEPRYEAKDLLVEGNVFVGGQCAVAFVGVDGATVRFNTIAEPSRWAFRILQETRAEGFVPCRRGVVTDNLVVFRGAAWAEGGVNVGAGTDPGSFRFERNAWYALDDPDATKRLVRPPVPEKDGTYGRDPGLVVSADGAVGTSPSGPGKKAGAGALAR